MDQPPRQTNRRTAYQSDSVNQVLPSKTHQVDSKRDYGPLVQTNLTLKIIHRVVKLILQDTRPRTETDDSRAPPLLTRRRGCGRLRRLCRASWQEARVAIAVGAFVSPLSEHVSPVQPGGAPLVDGPALNRNQWHVPGDGPALNYNQWHVPGDGPALNCNQDMFRLQLCWSGGTSNLGVDAGALWAAQLFPPRQWF